MTNSDNNIDFITGLPVQDSRDYGVETVPVRDVTDQFLINENLPKGDNRINYAEGIELDFDAPVDTVDYGQILSNLSSIFNFNSENAFSSTSNDMMNDLLLEFLFPEL
ncbi:MAG: hypothetical protein KI793_23760 [Rivularia sp. (in: Bacteria)]|nr:hypothetical protein [Rivularia sp. MS3]